MHNFIPVIPVQPLWTRRGRWVFSAWLLTLSLLASGPAQALALASGYSTNDPQIKTGMVVSISTEGDSTLVERSRLSAPDKIIGVAVRLDDGLLTVASEDSKVYVATAGEVQAYVLDLNGDIKKGDNLTISPVRGILMKAAENTTSITGVALEDFNADGAETETVPVQNESSGQTARLGQIKINIDPRIARGAPIEGTTFFERLGRSFVDREVSEVQILAAFVIFLVLLVVEGGLMYGAIASTITALGRNPYSKKLIYIAFARSIGLACVVLLLGLGAMYMVLRL